MSRGHRMSRTIRMVFRPYLRPAQGMNAPTRQSLFTGMIVALTGAVLYGCNAQISSHRPMTPEEKAAVARMSRYTRGRFDAARNLRKEGNVKAAEAEYKSMLADRLTKPFPTLRLEYADLLESEGKLSEAMQVVRPLIFSGGGS